MLHEVVYSYNLPVESILLLRHVWYNEVKIKVKTFYKILATNKNSWGSFTVQTLKGWVGKGSFYRQHLYQLEQYFYIGSFLIFSLWYWLVNLYAFVSAIHCVVISAVPETIGQLYRPMFLRIYISSDGLLLLLLLCLLLEIYFNKMKTNWHKRTSMIRK